MRAVLEKESNAKRRRGGMVEGKIVCRNGGTGAPQGEESRQKTATRKYAGKGAKCDDIARAF